MSYAEMMHQRQFDELTFAYEQSLSYDDYIAGLEAEEETEEELLNRACEAYGVDVINEKAPYWYMLRDWLLEQMED